MIERAAMATDVLGKNVPKGNQAGKDRPQRCLNYAALPQAQDRDCELATVATELLGKSAWVARRLDRQEGMSGCLE